MQKQDKSLIWHIQGGLGKNIAGTALIGDLKQKYPDRKVMLVVSHPEAFLSNPFIDRVYHLGHTPYFYQDHVEGKDVLLFRHEPYNQTAHITKKQHLIKNIWSSYSVPAINNLVGFEYWTGIYGPDQANKDLGPHYDKDELHWARTGGQEDGEVIRPVIGTVYYPKPMDIDGGYLEIFSKGEDNEPERIQPVYNRLVIFDAGNHKHRVTEVTRGIRYAIAINLWQTELLAAKEGSMTIEKHNW